jgi:hypothetical protein
MWGVQFTSNCVKRHVPKGTILKGMEGSVKALNSNGTLYCLD